MAIRTLNATDKIKVGIQAAKGWRSTPKATWSWWMNPDFANSVSGADVWKMTDGILDIVICERDGVTPTFRMKLFSPSANAKVPITDGIWTHCHVVFDGTRPANEDKLRIWFNKIEQSPTYSGAAFSTELSFVLLDWFLSNDSTASALKDFERFTAWIGVAITDAVSIAKIYDGCALLVEPTAIGLDIPLMTRPMVDLGPSEFAITETSGTHLLVDGPPGLRPRSSCKIDGRFGRRDGARITRRRTGFAR